MSNEKIQNKVHSVCGKEAELPCSCCGCEFHALSHPDCSLPSARSCREYWENQEKFRLNQLEELKNPFESELDLLKFNLVIWKDYRDNKMANDTKTPQDIKDYICEHIISSEKRIARNESLPTSLEDLEKLRLEGIESFQPENFYSWRRNRLSNTDCPHWKKYAGQKGDKKPQNKSNKQEVVSTSTNEVNKENEPNKKLESLIPENNLSENSNHSQPNSSEILPSKNDNEKSFSVNSLNSPKTSSNIGIIIAIVMFAAFSVWKKMK